MNVAAIKSYRNAELANTLKRTVAINSSEKKTNSAADMIGTKSSSTSAGAAREIVSKSERNYFMKLFPQNSAQIERHEIFNRKGKISSQSFSKGKLVDFTV